MDIIPFLYSIFENLAVPSWIQNTLLWVLIGWTILLLISNSAEQIQRTFSPLWFLKKEKERRTKRQGFCRFIENSIILTNQRDLQIWDDARFTELEAEVEAEGKRRKLNLIPFVRSTSKTITREKSLTKALEASRENFILLEGGPGSGKSVSLRHVALKLVRQAKSSKSTREIIPIIINLKNLVLKPGEKPDSGTITRFVLETINYLNDPLVENYLQDSFEREKTEGNWLFLFDSFDETPEILGASDQDQVIQHYLDAISSFISMGRCRGIIASRYFNNHIYANYPKFRILPLTLKQTLELVQKANLNPLQATEVFNGLEQAPREIRDYARTPLFLSLLIDFIRQTNQFPKTTFIVYQNFVDFRLKRDCKRIQQRFSINTGEINEVAQQVAYCMSADPLLGLNPSRNKLYKSLVNFGYKADKKAQCCLDALELVGLGTGDNESLEDLGKNFSFCHRRFQEYYATKAVLQRSTLLYHKDLLSNPRWRETTVTLFQILPDQELNELIRQADILTTKYVNRILKAGNKSPGQKEICRSNYQWPVGLYHLFSLLQDGLSSRKYLLLPRTREMAGKFLIKITDNGSFPDRKWALEIAAIAPQPALECALRPAIESPSLMMNDIAYRQVAQLEQIPSDIGNWIRRSLAIKMSTGELMKQRFAISAHYSRLKDHTEFMRIARVMRILPVLDFTNLIMISLLLIFYNFFLYFTMNSYGPVRTSGTFAMATFVPLGAYSSFKRSGNPRHSPGSLLDPSYALISAVLRASLVGLALYLLTFTRYPLSAGILAGILFYFLIIPPTALFALLKGVVNQNDWAWLLSPVCLPLSIAAGKVKISFDKAFFALVVIVVAMFGVLFLGFYLSIKFGTSNLLNTLLIIFILIFYIIMIGILVISIAEKIQERRREKVVWNRLYQKKQIESDEFRELFLHLQSFQTRIRFLEYVHKEKLLTPTVKSEKSVREIIALIETGDIYEKIDMPADEKRNFKNAIILAYKMFKANGIQNFIGIAEQNYDFFSAQPNNPILNRSQKNISKVMKPVTHYSHKFYQKRSAPLLEQATMLLEDLKSRDLKK